MSRIGKKPLALPEGVKVSLTDDEVIVEGKLGKLSEKRSEEVTIEISDNIVTVKPVRLDKTGRSQWGLYRSLIENMVEGVSKSYKKNIEIKGVGFRAAVKGDLLTMTIGYSHDYIIRIPQGVAVKCLSPTVIEFSGIDRKKVTQLIAKIYHFRKPEPYKGKGVIPEGTYVQRKEGKKK